MVKNVSRKAIIILYVFVMLFIIMNGTLTTVPDTVGTVMTVLPVFAGISFLLWARGQFTKHEEKLDKLFDRVFIIYLAVMFVVQILPAETLRFTPMWDLDAVYGGAISWMNNGDLHEYNDYFLWFPNNFGLLTIYKTVFSAVHAIFGDNADYYKAAVFMGSLSLTVTRFSVVMICKKLLGTASGYLAMLMMLICPVMYFMSEAFYTDVLSLWAAPLTLLLFIYGRETKKVSKKLLLYLGSALAATFGAEIKITVLVIVIALALSMLIRGEFKELGMFAAVQLAVVLTVFACFDSLYDKNFDTEKAKIMNTPVTHWIMMGVKNEGKYNGEDYDFTRSFEDIEERDKALKEEIIKRYKERGLGGAHQLRRAKTRIDFGDGTLGISDFLDDGVVNPSKIHDLILYDGENYKTWYAVCGIYFLILLISMLMPVYGSLKGEESSDIKGCVEPALYMSIIGIWTFLMFWEASARYFSNFYGLILLTAAWGLSSVKIKTAAAAETPETAEEQDGKSDGENA